MAKHIKQNVPTQRSAPRGAGRHMVGARPAPQVQTVAVEPADNRLDGPAAYLVSMAIVLALAVVVYFCLRSAFGDDVLAPSGPASVFTTVSATIPVG